MCDLSAWLSEHLCKEEIAEAIRKVEAILKKNRESPS